MIKIELKKIINFESPQLLISPFLPMNEIILRQNFIKEMNKSLVKSTEGTSLHILSFYNPHYDLQKLKSY